TRTDNSSVPPWSSRHATPTISADPLRPPRTPTVHPPSSRRGGVRDVPVFGPRPLGRGTRVGGRGGGRRRGGELHVHGTEVGEDPLPHPVEAGRPGPGVALAPAGGARAGDRRAGVAVGRADRRAAAHQAGRELLRLGRHPRAGGPLLVGREP